MDGAHAPKSATPHRGRVRRGSDLAVRSNGFSMTGDSDGPQASNERLNIQQCFFNRASKWCMVARDRSGKRDMNAHSAGGDPPGTRNRGRPKLQEATAIDHAIRDAALNVLLEHGEA